MIDIRVSQPHFITLNFFNALENGLKILQLLHAWRKMNQVMPFLFTTKKSLLPVDTHRLFRTEPSWAQKWYIEAKHHENNNLWILELKNKILHYMCDQ